MSADKTRRAGRLRIAVAVPFLLGAGICSAEARLALDEPMHEDLARAMLSRFGYGATPASLAEAARQTPREYLTHAVRDGSHVPTPISDAISQLPIAQPLDATWARLGPGGSGRTNMDSIDGRKALQQEEHGFASAAVQARLLTMANDDNQGRQALLSFWLNHFSIFAPKSLDKLLAWDYAQALERAMAADSFKELLRASFRHPAMQVYLDNAQSTSPESPAARMAAQRGKQLGVNENLARELLELHTLGVGGGYTQRDVQELARIITGAGVYSPRMDARKLEGAGATRDGVFLFDPRRHDFGEKTFLGQRFPAGHGLDEIERALDLMAMHPATARHIAMKLAQRFVADDPSPQLVDALAAAYLRSNGRISAMLWPLVASPQFSASLGQRAKFKEPVDYVLSVARAACGDRPIDNGKLLAAVALDMGQAPFMHTTPDGYATRESDWLSPAAMAKRVRFAMGVAGERVRLSSDACGVDADALARLAAPLSAQTEQARASLSPREQAALLLAAPEFMRR